MAEAMNISINMEEQENANTDDAISVDVTSQKATFSASPKKRTVRLSAGYDVIMLSPDKVLPRSAEKRKILAERKPEEEITNVEAREDRDEPTYKKARFTRHALQAAYAAPSFTAPVTWSADAGSDGSALYLGEKQLVVGLNDGRVPYMDFEGHVTKVQQLPLPAKSLIAEGSFLYAWCPAQFSFDTWKGALYDLSQSAPRFLFDVEKVGEWMTLATMRQGMLVLGDDKGSLALFGANGELVWFKEATDGRGTSKMLLADQTGIYLGHRKKVVKYDAKDGSELWTYQASGRAVAVHQAIQDKTHIFVEMGAKVLKLTKADGEMVEEYVPLRHRASNVCIGGGFLITGSCPTVLFDLETAEEKFRMNFAGRLNDAMMAMHPSGKLFAVWDKIYCMNLNLDAVERAVEGKSMRTREITLNQAAPDVPGGEVILKTAETGGGTTVEVREDDQGQVVVYPLDGLYQSGWQIRFPKHLQVVGKRYIVDQLIPHESYKFYSIRGEIRELVSAEEKEATDNAAKEAMEATAEATNDTTNGCAELGSGEGKPEAGMEAKKPTEGTSAEVILNDESTQQ